MTSHALSFWRASSFRRACSAVGRSDATSFVSWAVTPNFVLPGNGPADLIRLPEMVRRTKSRCLKWSTGPFQAAQNGPTLPVLVR